MRFLLIAATLMMLVGCGSTVSSGTAVPEQTGKEYFVSSERTELFQKEFAPIATQMKPAIRFQQLGSFRMYRMDATTHECPDPDLKPSTFRFGDNYDGPVVFCSDARDIIVRAFADVKDDQIVQVNGFALGTSKDGIVEMMPNQSGFLAQLLQGDNSVVRAKDDMSVDEIKKTDKQVLDRLAVIRESFGW